MILAAGFGTRFRPITWSVPKPMIPVCNLPLIGWATDSMIASGIGEIVVNLHHLPDPIEKWLSEFTRGRAEIRYSYEDQILGTGGGVRKVRSFFEGEKSFVLMNGDTIQFPPFDDLVAAQQNAGSLAALLLRHSPDGESFTRVWYADGLINHFGNDGDGEPLMFAGAHAMSNRIFERLPDRDFSGLTEDVYIPELQTGGATLAGVVHDGIWFDVGTPERYMEATAGVLSAMLRGEIAVARQCELQGDGSLVHETARAGGVASKSVIGAGSSIDSSASLSRTVVWNDCIVPAGCRVKASILSHGVHLPEGAAVENVLIAQRTGAEETEDHTHVRDQWLIRAIDAGAPWRFG